MSHVRSGFGLQYDPTARARANACLLRDGTEVMTGAIRVASADSFTLLNSLDWHWQRDIDGSQAEGARV